MQYIFSPSTKSFYLAELEADYRKSNTWPTDGIEVTDDVFNQFSGTPPEGKTRGAGKDSMPAWVDLPAKTNNDLYKEESAALNIKYKNDVNVLSESYATATLADGPSQNVKQTAIYQQYQSLKAQYVTDSAALKEH
ncbi:tail fiber assembly protein [Pantoea stewartii]|uniref:tail fiber assembly protein n=1 Tax=Pantoea stewartii TaxID=66269 RepID=UPI0025A15C83|nr:tail fiber assembly protein [Pantoea stewartii]